MDIFVFVVQLMVSGVIQPHTVVLQASDNCRWEMQVLASMNQAAQRDNSDLVLLGHCIEPHR